MHFFYENLRNFIRIALKFALKNPNDSKSSLVHVMAWHAIGNNPLPEPLMTLFTDAYMRHPASMS